MKESAGLEVLFLVHLNVLNAGTKGVNAAISSRKHISAAPDEGAGGGAPGVRRWMLGLCSSKHAKYQSVLSTSPVSCGGGGQNQRCCRQCVISLSS